MFIESLFSSSHGYSSTFSRAIFEVAGLGVWVSYLFVRFCIIRLTGPGFGFAFGVLFCYFCFGGSLVWRCLVSWADVMFAFFLVWFDFGFLNDCAHVCFRLICLRPFEVDVCRAFFHVLQCTFCHLSCSPSSSSPPVSPTSSPSFSNFNPFSSLKSFIGIYSLSADEITSVRK